MKGITPVISIVLLLLLGIALSGATYMYFFSVYSSGTSKAFEIVDVIGSAVIVRNIGTENITDFTSAALDGADISVGIFPGTIMPGSMASVSPLAVNISSGNHVFRICSGSLCLNGQLTVLGPGSGGSCLDILSSGGSVGDGIYNLNMNGIETQVFCDMSTDGGGWTLAAICTPNGVDVSNNSLCWQTGALGSVTDPNSTISVKLSDASIRSVLMSGENVTRAWWRQEYRYNAYNPRTEAMFNKISNPALWSSSGCGSQGKEFMTKYSLTASLTADIAPISADAYAKDWSNPIYSKSTGCSCAVNGWSNSREDSCGGEGTWIAGCERGPSMGHCCACTTYLERADIILWIR